MEKRKFALLWMILERNNNYVTNPKNWMQKECKKSRSVSPAWAAAVARFEDVYKFIRGHRLSLGGSPRSPPFYFLIFIEPMNCFPRSQSQIFLEYWESMYHNISIYFPSLLNPWIVFQQVNHRYFWIFRIFRTFFYISLSYLCWYIELFSRKSIMRIFVIFWQFRIFRLIRIFHSPMFIEPLQ